MDRAFVLGMIIFVTFFPATHCYGDPPQGRLFGVKLQTSSETLVGYVDSMRVKTLFNQVYGPAQSTRTYSDDEVLQFLRKEPQLRFYSGMDEIDVIVELPAHIKASTPTIKHHYPLIISTGHNGTNLSSSSITNIIRFPGHLDGKSIFSVVPMSKRELELFKSQKPFFICLNANLGMTDHFWASFNNSVGAETLQPLCNRTPDQWPSAGEQATVLKSSDVFHFVVQVD